MYLQFYIDNEDRFKAANPAAVCLFELMGFDPSGYHTITTRESKIMHDMGFIVEVRLEGQTLDKAQPLIYTDDQVGC